MLGGTQSFSSIGFSFCLLARIYSLWIRISNHAEPKVEGMRSTKSRSVSLELGMIVMGATPAPQTYVFFLPET